MRRVKSGEGAAMADQPEASRDVREVRQDAGAKEPDEVREVQREGHRDGSTKDGAKTPDGTLLQLRRISGRVARIRFLRAVQEEAKRISPQVDKPRPGPYVKDSKGRLVKRTTCGFCSMPLTLNQLSRDAIYCSRYCKTRARRVRNPKIHSSDRTRSTVLARDDHACLACGATSRLELHHIVRTANGGTSKPDNLATLCAPCHYDLHYGINRPPPQHRVAKGRRRPIRPTAPMLVAKWSREGKCMNCGAERDIPPQRVCRECYRALNKARVRRRRRIPAK